MMRILNKREKFIACSIVFVICLLAAGNLVVLPLVKRNEFLNREIQFTALKLNKYKWLLNNKERIFKKYGGDTTSILSASGLEVNVLSELENAAKLYGIAIIDVRSQGVFKDSGGPRRESVDLRAEGTIQDFVKFIYAIENSIFMFNISRFQLKSKSNSSLLEGSFSISQIRI